MLEERRFRIVSGVMLAFASRAWCLDRMYFWTISRISLWVCDRCAEVEWSSALDSLGSRFRLFADASAAAAESCATAGASSPLVVEDAMVAGRCFIRRAEVELDRFGVGRRASSCQARGGGGARESASNAWGGVRGARRDFYWDGQSEVASRVGMCESRWCSKGEISKSECM